MMAIKRLFFSPDAKPFALDACINVFKGCYASIRLNQVWRLIYDIWSNLLLTSVEVDRRRWFRPWNQCRCLQYCFLVRHSRA